MLFYLNFLLLTVSFYHSYIYYKEFCSEFQNCSALQTLLSKEQVARKEADQKLVQSEGLREILLGREQVARKEADQKLAQSEGLREIVLGREQVARKEADQKLTQCEGLREILLGRIVLCPIFTILYSVQ